MIGREHCEAILKKALALSQADETEVYLSVQDLDLTRYATNIIHQNVSHSNAVLNIRAVAGRRQGRATTNNLSDEGLEKAVEQAHRNALMMPEDPDFKGLPSPGQPLGVHTYDENTALCSPETRAQVVAIICRKSQAQGLEASGAYRTGTQEMAVMSSRGAAAYHAGTFAGLIITVMSDTSAGWGKGGSWRTSDIEAEALADSAIDKALRGRDPRPIEPGMYTVVLDPYAVDDILGALSLYGMGAQMVQEGRSWMSSTLGQQAMSPSVSIWDDGTDPGGWPVPFDTEGVPRQRVDIVKDGVVLGPVYNSYTAGKEARSSTGHQTYVSGGPLPNNLFMKEGDGTLDGMIASTRNGLYITRFHYTRLAHSGGCVMTGMTRDGVFLIENGELAYPVKNLRFTQSYVEALAGVEAVSGERKLLMNEGGFATKVPTMKLSSFNFTGVTV